VAAIGIIIFAKQIHILLGIDPAALKGMEPIELYEMIPHSIANADPRVALVGAISLLIIFGIPFLKGKYFKVVPPPMIVLLVTIPMALLMDFKHTEPAFDLVKIGDFWASVGFNADFSAIGNPIFFGSMSLCSFLSTAWSRCLRSRP
jgi:MFS superfamily sulfate permease-like transporter